MNTNRSDPVPGADALEAPINGHRELGTPEAIQQKGLEITHFLLRGGSTMRGAIGTVVATSSLALLSTALLLGLLSKPVMTMTVLGGVALAGYGIERIDEKYGDKLENKIKQLKQLREEYAALQTTN